MSDAAWHEWRGKGIGGSDIAGIMGLSNWSSPYRVWAEKVGAIPPGEDSARKRTGRYLESAIAQEFHDATDLHVAGEQTWCQHVDHPWMRCTVDGFVLDHPLELSPSAFSLRDFLDDALAVFEAKSDGRFRYPDDEIPAGYQCQGQWAMAVTGLQRVMFGVYHSGFRFRTYTLERDELRIAELIAAARSLWFDHIVTGVAPPPDGSDATADVLATLYPDAEVGAVAEVDPSTYEAWRKARDYRLALDAHAKAAKAEERLFENTLREQIGAAEIGTLDGAPVLTLRTTTREGYTVKPTSYRTIRPAPKNLKGNR